MVVLKDPTPVGIEYTIVKGAEPSCATSPRASGNGVTTPTPFVDRASVMFRPFAVPGPLFDIVKLTDSFPAV